MRIVIDMQGAQTDSRFRGIGRYSLSFAKAVVIAAKHHDVFLVMNGLFSETLQPLRKAFEGLLPAQNMLVWEVPGPLGVVHASHQPFYDMAKHVRHAFIANLKPDVVHLTSLFEGYVDNAVAEIAFMGPQVLNSVAFYDLIPFVNKQQYLDPNPKYAKYYLEKIEQLKRADVCLAISAFSAQEAESLLPELKGHVVNVSTAIDAHFVQVQLEAHAVKALHQKFGIQRQFILYTGGADERKNLPRLIQAFAVLPAAIRDLSQLVFAGRLADHFIGQLLAEATRQGLRTDELIFTGYISDEELIQLYNTCHCFVFPSWQEGFGLPALEAMACGAATLTSNTSSLPEVVGFEPAMFNPFSVLDITQRIGQVFADADFRQNLIAHGLSRAKLFTWEDVAQRALASWESQVATRSNSLQQQSLQLLQQGSKPKPKPKLALVSPWPPTPSGIADYSATLVAYLSKHYDIDLVSNDAVELESSDLVIRNQAWLQENAHLYDRVLYQLGNSPVHSAALTLLRQVPGVVMLHDFYLSGLKSWCQMHNDQADVWTRALYQSHGYAALKAWHLNAHSAMQNFPVNLEELQHAKAVLVHSNYAKNLAVQWYGPQWSNNIDVLPLLRELPPPQSKEQARQALGIAPDVFLICSFGFIDQAKQSQRVFEAWAQSELSALDHCMLVFVGQNEGGLYGEQLIHSIESSSCGHRVHITGYLDATAYQQYLAAADMAVQLRVNARGETSAAALDCVAHGIPLIVNANGSMAELPEAPVWKLDDHFKIEQLTQALQTLYADKARRQHMSAAGVSFIRDIHHPAACALAYFNAIEACYAGHERNADDITSLVSCLLPQRTQETMVMRWAESISLNFPAKRAQPRLFLDVTGTYSTQRQTGIERVALALVKGFTSRSFDSFRAEPVHLSFKGERWHARYARQFTLAQLAIPGVHFEEDVVEPQAGDFYITLDLASAQVVQASQAGLFKRYQQRGVKMYAVVFDLLPVSLPEVFPSGARQMHTDWLMAINQLDGVLCISKAVQAEFVAWQQAHPTKLAAHNACQAMAFELGADLSAASFSNGVHAPAEEQAPDGAQALRVASGRNFLSVGTLEPRKNHLQALEAFELLWAQGVDVNWWVVGREGWTGLPPSERSAISSLSAKIKSHPELNQRLFWVEDASDERLRQMYASADCLLVTSMGEGLGLPLLEAAHHGLPLLLRDLPVFREVAGSHAHYFRAATPQQLAQSVQDWLVLEPSEVPNSAHIKARTWQESVDQLAGLIQQQQASPSR